MAPSGTIAMTTVLLCLTLALLCPAPADGSQRGRSCCTRYNRKPVPFQRIKGFREQSIKENCHIEAIIFYTVKNHEICATRRDAWVRKSLELLSSKLQKMSKADSAAHEAALKRGENPSFGDGSGSFVSTTESYRDNTESFY